MRIEFHADRLGDLELGLEWASSARTGSAGLTLTGDRVGLRELFLYCGSKYGAAATSLGELLDHLLSRGVPVELNPFGISSDLNHGLVPFPYSEYRDIYSLSMGDAADIAGTGRFAHG